MPAGRSVCYRWMHRFGDFGVGGIDASVEVTDLGDQFDSELP